MRDAFGNLGSKESRDDLVRLFGKHIVLFGWVDQTGPLASENNGNGRQFQVSAFVVSIRGVWFLITAGHILEDLDKAKEKGQVLKHYFIDDSWGSKRNNIFFFDFESASKSHYCDDERGLDYGAIRLRPNYRDTLNAGGIKPLTETSWESVPDDLSFFFVFGFPSQFMKFQGDEIKSSCVMVPIRPIAEPPELARGFPRIYGGIPGTLVGADNNEELTDFDGMSGGPIFGMKKVKNGLSYWIVGIQNAVNKIQIGPFAPGKIIIGGYFLSLGLALEEWINVQGGDDL